jgi:hypothetical protein
MAKLGLKKAAEETGKSPSTIHRAMDSGRLSYELNEHGERVVDTAELFRVFPPKPPEDIPNELQGEQQDGIARHALQLAKMEVELHAEREKIAMLKKLLEDMREEHQADRREKERLLSLLEKQTLLLPKSQEDILPIKKRRWWHVL